MRVVEEVQHPYAVQVLAYVSPWGYEVENYWEFYRGFTDKSAAVEFAWLLAREHRRVRVIEER